MPIFIVFKNTILDIVHQSNAKLFKKNTFCGKLLQIFANKTTRLNMQILSHHGKKSPKLVSLTLQKMTEQKSFHSHKVTADVTATKRRILNN